ncbi:MAG: M50 family metallopeptidase [Candidatus Paceibacterota bacterium]
MNFGIALTLVVIFGYISNALNWRFLNYKITHFLYYVGAVVHESSHAILCILTGAEISEFKVFSNEPHVTHSKSKIPVIGMFLIASAPIYGGLFFLYVINHYWLGNYFTISPIKNNWQNTLLEPIRILKQINILQWQSWVMIFLFLNIGAMIGPSFQDLKNIWPVVLLMFLVKSYYIADICIIALSLILVNIAIQLCLILLLSIFSWIKKLF